MSGHGIADQDTVFLSKEQTLYQPPLKDFGYGSNAGIMDLNGTLNSNNLLLLNQPKTSQQTNLHFNNSARTDGTVSSLYKNKKNQRQHDYQHTLQSSV